MVPDVLKFLVLLLGAVCFALAACNVPRANWIAIGLLLWILVPLASAAEALH